MNDNYYSDITNNLRTVYHTQSDTFDLIFEEGFPVLPVKVSLSRKQFILLRFLLSNIPDAPKIDMMCRTCEQDDSTLIARDSLNNKWFVCSRCEKTWRLIELVTE